jgi:hypothetical protein
MDSVDAGSDLESKLVPIRGSRKTSANGGFIPSLRVTVCQILIVLPTINDIERRLRIRLH